MLIQTNNGTQVNIKPIEATDYDKLFDYLQHLSSETKKRFGPHLFDKQGIHFFYQNHEIHQGFVGIDTENGKILAYFIIKIGFIEKDKQRFEKYGIMLHSQTDATFAPSVADNWQGEGLGKQMWLFIFQYIKNTPIKRIILWGGVQADNPNAIKFYEKLGFKNYGQFERNGQNYDMMLDLS